MLGSDILQAVDAKYTEAAAKVGPNQMVTFEGDEITLDIQQRELI